MQREQLMEQACALTGLDDFGDVPFEEPLDVFLTSLDEEAKLDDERRTEAVADVVGNLAKRLRLVEDRERNPGIAEEVISSPVVIVGAPRTGSTHLHALLAQVEAVRAPLQWEQLMPSPPPDRATYDTDPRIAQVDARLAQLPVEVLQRHPLAANRPEQCNGLLDWSFINFAWNAAYEIPTYLRWFLDADHGPAYEAHRRTLQHLQWRVPGRWVLKYPKHLFALGSLLDQYPDARLIWTHRDPAVFVSSVASLTGLLRSATPGYDPQRFGQEWAVYEEMALRRGVTVRDQRPDPDRDLDVRYRDLMRDQVGTVERICRWAGIDWTDEDAERVQAWIDDHPRTKHGEHRYTPGDHGLDADRLRARFGFYMQRFDIEPEEHR